jgi:hypothetical protein
MAWGYVAAALATAGLTALAVRSRLASDKPADPSAPPSPGGVTACRASIAIEPGLKRTTMMRGGHVYNGQDPGLVAHLRDYLAAKAAAASSPDERRAILAFQALQGREGSTAAINTWDDQIFTWGTGWAALGALPMVMDRLVAASPAALKRLAACGVLYMGRGDWHVVDDKGQLVTDKKAALQVIRSSPMLLSLFINLARDPATRDAVADAQLGAFLASSGKLAGASEIGTQALVNFAMHLSHWAPGYMAKAVPTAASAVPGAPSEDRDRQLAPAIVRAFYAAAPATAYIVAGWPQLKGYVRDMAKDGLDVTGDPLLSAAAPPGRESVA